MKERIDEAKTRIDADKLLELLNCSEYAARLYDIFETRTFDEAMDYVEKCYLRMALVRNMYHITKTAEMLGMDRKTVYNKINKHGLAL